MGLLLWGSSLRQFRPPGLPLAAASGWSLPLATATQACLVALYELGKLLCESSTYSDALKYFVMVRHTHCSPHTLHNHT